MEDAQAILAAIREPERAKTLGVDPRHVVIVGHSYGGLVSAHVAADDPRIEGVVLIAPWDPEVDARDLEKLDSARREQALATGMDDVPGRLGDVGPHQLGEEIMRDRAALALPPLAPRLATRPILILVAAHDSDDDKTQGLIDALAAQPHRLTVVTMVTDHGFDDHRIALETEVLNWLAKMPGAPRATAHRRR
jgi:pimeloyl-ACP methyl ester carboxylesterase